MGKDESNELMSYEEILVSRIADTKRLLKEVEVTESVHPVSGVAVDSSGGSLATLAVTIYFAKNLPVMKVNYFLFKYEISLF